MHHIIQHHSKTELNTHTMTTNSTDSPLASYLNWGWTMKHSNSKSTDKAFKDKQSLVNYLAHWFDRPLPIHYSMIARNSEQGVGVDIDSFTTHMVSLYLTAVVTSWTCASHMLDRTLLKQMTNFHSCQITQWLWPAGTLKKSER
jgi:hypothetical protein